MVYAIRHKKTGKYTSYSGSNKIPHDDMHLVDVQFAQTLATEASARASLKQLVSSRDHYADYVMGSKDFNRLVGIFGPQQVQERGLLYLTKEDMEIVEVALQVLRVVE